MVSLWQPPNETLEHVKVAADIEIKDLKVKKCLFKSIDRSILETILLKKCLFKRYIYNLMQKKY